MKRKTARLIATIALIAAITSCAGESRPTRFYTLTPAINSIANNQKVMNVRLAIGPVNLPSWLDRPQIVTRATENELYVSEFHQWAGSLQKNFTLTLAENLSSILGTSAVYIYPVRGSANFDYQVAVEVTRLDGYMEGEVTLSAIFTLFKDGGKTLLQTKKTVIKESVAGKGYDDLAKAESIALAKLSRQIAEVIRKDAG